MAGRSLIHPLLKKNASTSSCVIPKCQSCESYPCCPNVGCMLMALRHLVNASWKKFFNVAHIFTESASQSSKSLVGKMFAFCSRMTASTINCCQCMDFLQGSAPPDTPLDKGIEFPVSPWEKVVPEMGIVDEDCLSVWFSKRSVHLREVVDDGHCCVPSC